jgi:hypothetical protein
MAGDGLAQEACHHGTLVCTPRTICGVSDPWVATRLAGVVLLSGMHMTLCLASLRSPLWTYLSQTHTALLASVVAVGDGSEQDHGRMSRAFPL